MVGVVVLVYFALASASAIYFTKRLTVNDAGRRNPHPGTKEAVTAGLGVVFAKTAVLVAVALVLDARWDPLRGLFAFGAAIPACALVYTAVYDRTFGGALGLSTLVNVLLAIVSTALTFAAPGLLG